MRTPDSNQAAMFSYVGPEDRIPKDHPLRAVLKMTNDVLRSMNQLFERMYAPSGRASIPPERLLRALLLQILYSVRSERQLMEQLNYNILFRWFVGLNMDDPIWHVTTFSKNRDRLLEGEVAQAFFEKVRGIAQARGLLSSEHFTVDGTLLEAWASQKSFQPKDHEPPSGGGLRNADVNFRGESRKNETHASTTDFDARQYRKSKNTASILCYMHHVLMENRNGLIVDLEVTHASGRAEREAALAMLERRGGRRRLTLGADKGYDTAEFLEELRAMNVTPHIAANTNRRGGSTLDARTTRHEGYQISQRKRKRVEEIFGWKKTVGGLRKLRHRGIALVGQITAFASAAYNMIRMTNLART